LCPDDRRVPRTGNLRYSSLKGGRPSRLSHEAIELLRVFGVSYSGYHEHRKHTSSSCFSVGTPILQIMAGYPSEKRNVSHSRMSRSLLSTKLWPRQSKRAIELMTVYGLSRLHVLKGGLSLFKFRAVKTFGKGYDSFSMWGILCRS
jgi:hypothetical protein